MKTEQLNSAFDAMTPSEKQKEKMLAEILAAKTERKKIPFQKYAVAAGIVAVVGIGTALSLNMLNDSMTSETKQLAMADEQKETAQSTVSVENDTVDAAEEQKSVISENSSALLDMNIIDSDDSIAETETMAETSNHKKTKNSFSENNQSDLADSVEKESSTEIEVLEKVETVTENQAKKDAEVEEFFETKLKSRAIKPEAKKKIDSAVEYKVKLESTEEEKVHSADNVSKSEKKAEDDNIKSEVAEIEAVEVKEEPSEQPPMLAFGAASESDETYYDSFAPESSFENAEKVFENKASSGGGSVGGGGGGSSAGGASISSSSQSASDSKNVSYDEIKNHEVFSELFPTYSAEGFEFDSATQTSDNLQAEFSDSLGNLIVVTVIPGNADDSVGSTTQDDESGELVIQCDDYYVIYESETMDKEEIYEMTTQTKEEF